MRSPLNVSQKQKLVKNAEQYLDRPYDIYFEWSNRAIYCSEIIWKAYDQALGIQLAPLQHLKQFDLKQSSVQKLMKQRYGQNIPLNETVIAPKAIYDSKHLQEVFRNWDNKKAQVIMLGLFYKMLPSRIWRPYGDSNPGYRRERAMS